MGNYVRQYCPTFYRTHRFFRHTAATELYSHTKDLRTVQHLLGHRAMSSTMKYIAPAATEELRQSLTELRHEWLYRAKPQTEVEQ